MQELGLDKIKIAKVSSLKFQNVRNGDNTREILVPLLPASNQRLLLWSSENASLGQNYLMKIFISKGFLF